MDYRTLLVHVDDATRDDHLDLAARLALRFDAELAAAYLVPTRELTPFTSALLPDAVVAHRLQSSGDAQARAEARFREVAIRHALAKSSFSAPAGRAVDAAIAHARCADLCVLAQPRGDDAHKGFANELAHAVVMQSGRPALVVPFAGVTSDIGRRVLIAWKGARESARAAADALPFLKRAEDVVVVAVVAPGADEEPRAGADVAAWLAHHGVRAQLRHEVAEDVDAGNLLLSRAADMSSDLIVMGAYSRPRLSEVVLGGVTRLMLQAMTVPVLMSH
jgi:nucleotide-binding universal stress UspA family protein